MSLTVLVSPGFNTLNCKRGGFVSTRHNDVRDFTAQLLSEVCHDVAVEPLLTPLTGETLKYKTAITVIIIYSEMKRVYTHIPATVTKYIL